MSGMGGGNSTGMTESRFFKGLIVLDIYPDDITVVGTNIYGDYSEKMAQMDQEDGFMSWGRRGSLDGPNSLFDIVYHVIYHKAKKSLSVCVLQVPEFPESKCIY
ncbi:hypothetical protein F5J12DRAFT_779250 [Pisolithus orientalis]|uniref:uncharacterized protein n=1 Tax=Pisolithus orientalis TaxID=936130 RepID=UPI00222549B0|nr:uncharacterized protein F5J12DRAFT_779250 [Pisolithus orientalis]KAI6032826.1 hypothetical protein F5J12DRAFT_779250 [Pisolithus orientalis]